MRTLMRGRRFVDAMRSFRQLGLGAGEYTREGDTFLPDRPVEELFREGDARVQRRRSGKERDDGRPA